MRLQRIITHTYILLVLFSTVACSSNSGDNGGRSEGTGGEVGSGGAGGDVGSGGADGIGGTGGSEITDGGVPFVDGSMPPCEGVCPVEDGGVIIPTEDGGTRQCFFITCQGRITACGDCSDNDGDSFVDNDDPECLGPCDNYEGEELLSGVGGETGEQCKADCYFDFGNGGGNDDCHWSRSCDPLEPKSQCVYVEGLVGGRDCPLPVQSDLCEAVCTPLTPNGCDCFGCCTFPELTGQAPGGGDGYVYIGSEEGCTFDTVTDPARCKACTPASSCLNTCERCEICLGKPTIPEDCLPGAGGSGGSGGVGGMGGMGGMSGTGGMGGMGGTGGSGRCPPGKQVCGLPGDDPCPVSSFCLTGCCTEIVVQ